MGSERLEAAVFDLDGVITRTAKAHFASWKQLFDDFLSSEPARQAAGDRRPFEADDYRAYVDGRPRFEGIRQFLASRGISLPEGAPTDTPDATTVHGLGARKNQAYLDLLDRLGVEIDAAAVELIRELRDVGVRVGVSTSSRNATTILHRAGLEGLFDAQVDGLVIGELGLKGKPNPDAFLECARRLDAQPARCMVVEDAAAGVRAGHDGRFGLVLGVDRGGNWMRLREAGADWIVPTMNEPSLDRLRQFFMNREHLRPNALYAWGTIADAIEGKRAAVFLDYDGTLTPVVARPELAILDDETRSTLRQLAVRWPTHVVSGRGLEDVRRLVGIDSLWIAGSHGFDIAPPRGVPGGKQVAPEVEPEVHHACEELRRATAGIPGVLVEDKRFSLAVHYRLVEPARVAAVELAVDEVLARHPALRKSHGKRAFQAEPAMDWDKGKAVSWLLERTGETDAVPIFLGDDTTDESALAAIEERGIGVVVTEMPRPTAARYSLQDTVEVRAFLERLASLPQGAR